MIYQKPKGTRDLFGLEVKRLEALNHLARMFFGKCGYEEMKTPAFESAELFTRSIGEHTDIVEKEIYSFEHDKKLYALRPEGTASVLRAFIENGLSLPRRFLYIGPMYRKEKPQKGRYREFVQIGIELLGEAEPFFDAEMIDNARKFVATAGAADFSIEVNSIGCPVCRAEYRKGLKEYLALHKEKICDDCRRRFEKNFLRIFDCKNEACQRVYADAPKITDDLCADCRQHYKMVKEFLAQFGVAFTENKKLVRGLDYYTRTVFEFKSSRLGAQDTFLAGGRYDLLMKELGGGDVPCIGWAMGPERMLLSMDEQMPVIKTAKIFFIATMGEGLLRETIILRDMLHEKDLACVMGNPADPIKSQMKDANRYGADYAVIYGENEQRDRVYAVKDMHTAEQQNIGMTEIGEWLDRITATKLD